jgi:uncharacterized Zn finger protein (UPF0148 family)
MLDQKRDGGVRFRHSFVLEPGAIMSLRVRCTKCRTAFVTADDQPGGTVSCPKCGARHRLPTSSQSEATVAGPVTEPPQSVETRNAEAKSAEPRSAEAATVFVPSEVSRVRSSRKRWLLVLSVLVLMVLGGVAALVFWPRVKPRKLDPVERVAESYLKALTKADVETQHRLGTIEEPPAIRSYQNLKRDRRRDRTVKGSFAPIAQLHKRIESEFAYDPAIGRFTPKHPLGAAAETLDAVHAAKEKAEKSGIYKKMASGDPDDIFDAAENFGKVFTELAEGALAPKKILPTYKMLVDESKPPIPPAEKELALAVADDPKTWDALLKRPFQTLKPDGPFVYERAGVNAEIWDQLGSLGEPPTTLRLSLVRFRLEGIDTGWRVTSARRMLPGTEEPTSPGEASQPSSSSGTVPAEEPPPARSLGNPDHP